MTWRLRVALYFLRALPLSGPHPVSRSGSGVARRSSPAAGRLEAMDRHTCILHAGSDSLEELALYVALKGFDFQVLEPPSSFRSCGLVGPLPPGRRQFRVSA